MTLSLIGPSFVPQAKIDELEAIPGWKVVRGPAVFLGVALDESFAVKTVIPKSAAAECGIQEGDTILSVNQTSMTDLNSIKIAILECKPGDEISLTFKRDEVEQTCIAKLTAPPPSGTRMTIPRRLP